VNEKQRDWDRTRRVPKRGRVGEGGGRCKRNYGMESDILERSRIEEQG